MSSQSHQEPPAAPHSGGASKGRLLIVDPDPQHLRWLVRIARPLAAEVTTASTFGLLASPEYPGYCATKAAIINLTREMALDYGPLGIRINCVCPGAIETPRFRGFPPKPTLGEGMTDEQRKTMGGSNKALLRMGRPEEIAYGVLFLVSEEASFVTGHALVVDGGQTIDA